MKKYSIESVTVADAAGITNTGVATDLMSSYDDFATDTRYLKIVPKLWGQEKWIVNNDLYCGKILELKPGFESSLHYHPKKDETFHILEGSCILNLEYKELQLARGATVRIQPGQKHSFWSSDPNGCRILEVSTPHRDEDVVRLRASSALRLEATDD